MDRCSMKAGLILTLFLLCGCVSNHVSEAQLVKDNEQAGFLTDYSVLKKFDAEDDSDFMRYINPRLQQLSYTSILLDSVSFYPAADNITANQKKTLDDISQHAQLLLEQSIQRTSLLVNTPSPTTLRLRVAITGVSSQDLSLKAYQYVPIAFLVTAAAGKLNDKVVRIRLEGELVDSLTGEVMIAATKSGFGGVLDNESEPLTLEKVNPLLNDWAAVLEKNLKIYMKNPSIN